MRSGRFEEERQPPFVREISVARCVRAKSRGVASEGALLSRRPSENKWLPCCILVFFVGNASSVSYMNIPSLFVCHDVWVSMRSRVLSCMCVRAVWFVHFCTSCICVQVLLRLPPALRRLSWHLPSARVRATAMQRRRQNWASNGRRDDEKRDTRLMRLCGS
jgi:hypothetical protein